MSEKDSECAARRPLPRPANDANSHTRKNTRDDNDPNRLYDVYYVRISGNPRILIHCPNGAPSTHESIIRSDRTLCHAFAGPMGLTVGRTVVSGANRQIPRCAGALWRPVCSGGAGVFAINPYTASEVGLLRRQLQVRGCWL